MKTLSLLLALIYKDLKVEVRERVDFYVKIGFTLAAGILASAAASYSQYPGEVLAGTMIAFALFLALFESFAGFIREALSGTLDGLRSSPVESWILILAKSTYSYIFLFSQLMLFSIIVKVFTIGLVVAWTPMLLWAGGVSLFLASVSAFVSASLSFGEARTGSVAFVVLVLSIPYLRVTVDPLITAFSGAHPPIDSLTSIWLGGASFLGFALVLSSAILD
ncbi:MAG: hypothetical protein F7B78_00130 [Desulfurococcales archaeon]|nr:hypothetical protein [Desulfurococcales archaeon]